ncbi:hypothetical protein [uncultured Nostoc sp.]|uniref:hypothetical protein n=1 Tax=uncultured Nostoc sp. TaxID=340711 RepID=UPI0035C9B750
MNRVISGLRNIRISQILVVFLVGFMFLLSQAFSYTNIALADVKTPEGTYYQGVPNGQGEMRNDTQIENTQNSQNPIKSAVDNIREKLNLDEKPPEATKEFLKSATNKVEETVEPVTGEKEGYYHNSSKK